MQYSMLENGMDFIISGILHLQKAESENAEENIQGRRRLLQRLRSRKRKSPVSQKISRSRLSHSLAVISMRSS